MKHLVKLFGLDEIRLKHIIVFIFQYIQIRKEDGETDLRVIRDEILSGDTPRFKAHLGRDAK